MRLRVLDRKFEIPYNFDWNYCDILEGCNLINDSIRYIYAAPFHEDYTTIIRADLYGAKNLTREEYVKHILKIKQHFQGKMQLLLQNKKDIMPIEMLKWYISLGFTHFCCGNPMQAKMIKEYDPQLTVIGSIVLHVTREELCNNEYYKQYFDEFVLDFSYGRKLQKIKELPRNKKYLILCNAYCHTNCDGDHHWQVKDEFEEIVCPGRLWETRDFSQSVLIRPMDLKYFDPWISTYKIQDRSWTTWEIVSDLILYQTDYSIYPGIEYDQFLYDTIHPVFL